MHTFVKFSLRLNNFSSCFLASNTRILKFYPDFVQEPVQDALTHISPIFKLPTELYRFSRFIQIISISQLEPAYRNHL